MVHWKIYRTSDKAKLVRLLVQFIGFVDHGLFCDRDDGIEDDFCEMSAAIGCINDRAFCIVGVTSHYHTCTRAEIQVGEHMTT